MARAELFMAAPPEAVFELLSDPRTYSDWVPGSKEIRAADGHWPAEDAAFDHRVGGGPLTVSDHTLVTRALPPVMLELRAHARPLGVARVVFELTPAQDGTRVLLIEEPANRLLTLLLGPLGHTMLKLRGAGMLRRLREMAEGARPRPGGTVPSREQLHADATET